jgi:hypothetical protein
VKHKVSFIIGFTDWEHGGPFCFLPLEKNLLLFPRFLNKHGSQVVAVTVEKLIEIRSVVSTGVSPHRHTWRQGLTR